jgi:hypothetical protein
MRLGKHLTSGKLLISSVTLGLLLAAGLCCAQAPPERMPFVAADAQGASGKIYQLTNIPGLSGSGQYDWSALYYHNSDSTIQDYAQVRPGNKLVLRRMARQNSIGLGSPVSLSYFSVDLDTGKFTAVTPPGLANGAFVKGPWLYVIQRDNPSQNFCKLVRHDLIGSKGDQVLAVLSDANKRMESNIAVSDDQRYVIWPERDLRSGAKVFHLKDLQRQDIEDLGLPIDVSRLAVSSTTVEHFQFLKGANAHVFICMNQSQSNLNHRIGVGRADDPRPSCVPLSAAPGTPLGSYNYAHPFVDIQGRLWICATRWGGSGLVPLGYVRFEAWDEYGRITKYSWFEMNGTPWQVHTNFTMSPEWFLGDGASVLPKGSRTGGPDAVQLLHMANGKVTSVVLAQRAGVDSPNGDLQPNVHLIHLMGRWGVLWTEWRTLVPGQAPSMNVFFAPLPWSRRPAEVRRAYPDSKNAPMRTRELV